MEQEKIITLQVDYVVEKVAEREEQIEYRYDYAVISQANGSPMKFMQSGLTRQEGHTYFVRYILDQFEKTFPHDKGYILGSFNTTCLRMINIFDVQEMKSV